MSFHRNLGSVCGILVMVLMFIIVIDSGGRFLFGKPLQGAVEISRLVLGWILFGSLTYGLVRGVHVKITLFLDKYSPLGKVAAEIIFILLSISFFILAIYSGWREFWLSFLIREIMPAPIWIPFWIGKLALPVGCFIIVIQLCIDLVINMTKIIRKEYK